MRTELQKKVDQAIRLIQSASKVATEHGQPLEVCYSGGKDSDVILELTRMAKVPYRAIYKNTSIDPPGTIKHAKDNGCEIMAPKDTFFHLMREHGWPSRKVRWCCAGLKEYKILDYAILGIRADESAKRKERYKEPEICRVYSKDDRVRQYFPILTWTKEDVAEFIAELGIKCHSLYYDENGIFHPERRLGCVGCPMQSKKQRLAEFRKHPRFVYLYMGGGDFYRKNHRLQKNKYLFKNVYEWFVCYLFCESITEFRERFGPNLFNGGVDCKDFLENYFGINLDGLQRKIEQK